MAKNNSKPGIIRVILETEKITPTILHGSIAEECRKVGIKPTITRSEISHFLFGDRPDRQISTYIKLLMGLNAIRRRPEPYKLEDVIETNSIIESVKKSKRNN
ncbi:MAG: hypothetical protein PHT07_15315 [Paludibacter sp.]|nr:hypothetical protein [Paludibacter sp.]